MKAFMLSIALLLACSVAHAATVTLPPPATLDILTAWCGQTTPIPVAAGFSQDGNYVVAVEYASTRCGGSGRGGGYRSTTYTGCGLVRWDLSGRKIDVVKIPKNADGSCSAPANTLYPAPQGYDAYILAGYYTNVVLVTP